MRKCKNCGIRVEDDVEECPLCGEPVTEQRRQQREIDEQRENVLRAGAHLEPRDEKTVLNAKIWLFEMVSLVAFTAGIIVFAVDFASEFSLTWSLFPLLAIGFLYLATSAVIALVRYPAVLLLIETAVVAGFLVLLDLLIADTNWFLSLALPITVLVALFSGATATAIAKLKLNALQGIAVAFLASGFFLVGLEFIINYTMSDLMVVSWSLIAFACTLSLFVLILFINKRLREHHSEFRKIFHIQVF